MFSWRVLLALAPDIVPLIVSTIMNVEQAIKGVLSGEIKKDKVMAVIKAFLQTKDFFTGKDDSETAKIYTLVSEAIDFFVMTFNYVGLFKTTKKLDFSKISPKGEN